MNKETEKQIKNLLRKELSYNDVKRNLNLKSYEEIQILIDEYVEAHGYPVRAKDIEKAIEVQEKGYKKFIEKNRVRQGVVDTSIVIQNRTSKMPKIIINNNVQVLSFDYGERVLSSNQHISMGGINNKTYYRTIGHGISSN